jgi:hypothetical protein
VIGLVGAAAAFGQTDYAASSRPDPEGVPTKVSIGFYVVDVESIDDLKQEFTADFYVVVRWKDARLALSEMPENGGQRVLPLSQIWQPELGILNRRDAKAYRPETVRVGPQGDVEYSQRIRGQFSSPLDLRRFPFDRQVLEMAFFSYRYGSDELEIEEIRALRHERFSIAGWRVGQPNGEATALEIPSSGTFAGLTLRLDAERERTFYRLTMVLPLILIALMAWSVFWIDPSLLPSQLAIATASVFTLIAFRLSLMWSLPKVSYLTVADSFVMAVTLLVFGALGETVVAGRISKSGREKLAKAIDRWARWIYAAALVTICLVTLT